MINIEQTTKEYYLSSDTALNIIPEGVKSGGWHPYVNIKPDDNGHVVLTYAGKGRSAQFNTNNIFNDYGIYDCLDTLKTMDLGDLGEDPIYAANHIRAVLDQFVYFVFKMGGPVNMLDVEGLFDIDSLVQLKAATEYYLKDGFSNNGKYLEFFESIENALKS